MLEYILFIPGFVVLIKGADFLVDGASSIAKKNNIPELVIGLTIVSFGTSLPELLVNLYSSIVKDVADMALGNIFGSNIANILLILGVSALFTRIPIKKSIYFTEIPISLIATFMVGFLANANLFEKAGSDNLALSRLDGAILLTFFFLFMSYIYVISKYKNEEEEEDDNEEEEGIEIMPTRKSVFLIVLGILGLFFGGQWVVDGAVLIAKNVGMSEKLIGLTIVAIGTSLPELVTSVTAARKGQVNLAVGNVIGSNIFNLLWILGISAVIKELPFKELSNDDILMIIFSSSLLFFMVIIGKKPGINRLQGFIFIVIYFSYLGFLVYRG